MSEKMKVLTYKGHPLMRKDNLVYYGSMADEFIVMLQILETKKLDDLELATKVSVQLQRTDPAAKGARPRGEEDGKGRLLHGFGCWLCVAGTCTERKISTISVWEVLLHETDDQGPVDPCRHGRRCCSACDHGRRHGAENRVSALSKRAAAFAFALRLLPAPIFSRRRTTETTS